MSVWRGKDDPNLDYSVQGWSRQCEVPTDWEGWEPHGSGEPPPSSGGQWFSIGAMPEEYGLGGVPRFISITTSSPDGYDIAVKDNPTQPTKLLSVNGSTVIPHAAYMAGRPWINPPFTATVAGGAYYSLVDDAGGGE